MMCRITEFGLVAAVANFDRKDIIDLEFVSSQFRRVAAELHYLV